MKFQYELREPECWYVKKLCRLLGPCYLYPPSGAKLP